MKLTAERDALVSALAIVERRVRAKSTIPILSHVLLTADTALTLFGHDMQSCATVTIASEIRASGSLAIPCAKFSEIVRNFPKGSTIQIDEIGSQVQVSSGRSRYKLPFLVASDFPAPLSVIDGAKTAVDPVALHRLLSAAKAIIEPDHEKPQYSGAWMHVNDGHLCVGASDGVRFIRIACEIAWDGPAIILPRGAIDEVLRLTTDDAALEWSERLLTISNSVASYTTKLVDAKVPEYQARLPEIGNSYIEFDCIELVQTIKRLATLVIDNELAIFEWPGNPSQVQISLTGSGDGIEHIECVSSEMEADYLALVPDQILGLLDAIDCDSVRFHIANHRTPFCITAPAHSNVLAVQTPCVAGIRRAAA